MEDIPPGPLKKFHQVDDRLWVGQRHKPMLTPCKTSLVVG